MNLDIQDDWQAEQYRDECLRREQILAALKIARSHGTPAAAVTMLALECGVLADYLNEPQPTMTKD